MAGHRREGDTGSNAGNERVNVTQRPSKQTFLCSRPAEEHTMREYLPDLWYPMPPMQFSNRKEQDRAEMRCLVEHGHQMHQAMEDNKGFIAKVFFCCSCGMTLDLRKKSWWQMFVWELKGRP